MKHKKIGRGTYYLGDVRKLLKELPPNSVDMIFTDPPYRVTSGGKYNPIKSDGSENIHKAGWHNSLHSSNDGKAGIAHNDIEPRAYLKLFWRVLKPGGHCYVMTNVATLESFLTEGRKAGFHLHNILNWKKNNKITNRWYMKELEIVIFFGKKPATPIRYPGSSQLKEAKNIPGKERLHPTQKPVSLIRHYIKNSSKKGQTVLDPFAGSGATAIAAERLGRKWILCEIDISYAKSSSARIERYVRKQARKGRGNGVSPSIRGKGRRQGQDIRPQESLFAPYGS